MWYAGIARYSDGWDLASWTRPGARRCHGSIVLLHDDGGDRAQTATALPTMIEGLLDRGFQFVTVTQSCRSAS